MDITLDILRTITPYPIVIIFSKKNNIRHLRLNSFKVKIAFFKRANGWRPFLYDFSIDFCKFLENPHHIIARLAFQFLKPYTNVNHSCPYDAGTSIIVKNFELNVDAFRSRFPIENGEYAISVSFFVKNKVKISINGSINHFNYKET
ncbi:GH21963 [Drosophila grimshawi]|uniref:GH21963 n=1 Tax=Drosophila grimshawi TaxID=7222 RepID=B4J8U6_DROGR|nr:GH21963 [Drosophila grimshawi]